MWERQRSMASTTQTWSVPFIIDAVNQTFDHYADHTAISWKDRAITYAELGRVCAFIEGVVLGSGIERGSLVALYFRDRWLMIPAMIACAAVGCPFMPLDVDIPSTRLRTLLEAVPLSAVICEESLNAEQIVGQLTQTIAINGALESASTDLGGHPLRRSAAGLVAEEFATVYFTSGSTGRPKAIAGRLIGVDAFVQFEIATLGLGAGCRVSQLGSPSFDGFLKDVFVPLCVGGTVCITPDRDLALRAGDLVSWLAQEQVEVLHMVPSMLRQLLEQPRVGERLSSLKALVLAGEQVRPGDVRRLHELFGDRIKTLNLYGPTETTLTKLCHIVRSEDATANVVPIGKPMPGTHVSIVGEGGQLCEPGSVGEILITTPYRALGYLGQPELTAERFVPDPEGSQDLAYRTGDLGRLGASGEYEFVGRVDNQVKIRGVRIELEEIEAVFSTNADVLHVAAIARQDSHGESYLACYCVLKTPTSTNDLSHHAAARLPRYMMPAVIRVVSSLPYTPNGKIDRTALAKYEPTVFVPESPTLAEATEIELALNTLFKEILDVSSVDSTASFFVLGGHSLLAMKLLARIYKELSVELSLRELFEHSSISALASYIDTQKNLCHA